MVYFITDGTGYVKIGKANDLEKRFVGIQNGNPRPIKCLRVLTDIAGIKHCDNEIEHVLHKFLSKYRACGEWFRIEGVQPLLDMSDEELIEFIKSIYSNFEDCHVDDNYKVMNAGDYKSKIAYQQRTINSLHKKYEKVRAQNKYQKVLIKEQDKEIEKLKNKILCSKYKFLKEVRKYEKK